MPEVFNHHKKNAPKDAVYIGRGSYYGNPFEIGKDGNRNEVINKYIDWVQNQPEVLVSIRGNLKGKNLVCYCKPRACHGDAILAIANAYPVVKIKIPKGLF